MTETISYDSGFPPLPGGEIDFPIPGSYPLDVMEHVDPRALEGTSLMVVTTIIDQGGNTVYPFAIPMLGGETDFPNPNALTILGQTVTKYLGGHVGTTTAPDDTPPNTIIMPRLLGRLSYQDSLFQGVDPIQNNQAASSQAGRGVINLVNTDGGLDAVAAMSWDGAQVDVWRGRSDRPRSTWAKIARMQSSGVRQDANSLQILIRDAGWKLESEIQPLRYGGSGGLDGDSSIKGVVKPYGIGYVFRAPVQTITAALLIGQVSNSSVFSIDVLEDGGQPITFTADYSSYDALAAATIAPGHYATCLARGLIRLGSTPTKQITCTFCGDNDLVDGKSHPTSRGEIVRRILTGLGNVRLDGNADLDTASFVALDNRYSDDLGYFWNQSMTKSSVLREVMAGLSGYYGFRFDGKLIVGAAELPASSPFLTLSFGRNFASTPKLLSYDPPRLATAISYQQNYTPMTRDQLQTGVPEATALIYSSQGLVETATLGSNATIWPTSPIVQIQGGFRFQQAAAKEAARQEGVFGYRRARWGVDSPMDLYSPVLGRVVKVEGWDRYGFAGGKLLRAVGLTANDNMNLTLELWG